MAGEKEGAPPLGDAPSDCVSDGVGVGDLYDLVPAGGVALKVSMRM